MSFTPDTLLALGAVVLIGVIVVAFSIGVGKWIIWLFGTESRVGTPVHGTEAAKTSLIREAA